MSTQLIDMMIDALRRGMDREKNAKQKRSLYDMRTYVIKNTPRISRENQISILMLFMKLGLGDTIYQSNAGVFVDLQTCSAELTEKIYGLVSFYIGKNSV